jgi:hypothetical protein
MPGGACADDGLVCREGRRKRYPSALATRSGRRAEDVSELQLQSVVCRVRAALKEYQGVHSSSVTVFEKVLSRCVLLEVAYG